MLISAFYDMGKELARCCPFTPDLSLPETKAFFETRVDQFALNFPNILGNETLIKEACIEHGKKGRITLKTLLKVNAKNGFKRALATMKR